MNNSTDLFKKTIENGLLKMAESDLLLAATLQKENKNIDDCIQYITNEVKKSGRCGFADEEIFAMAVHYYDEDDIEVGGKVQCKVVVNQEIQLTEQEKKEAKQKVFDQEVSLQRDKLKSKKKTQKNDTQDTQISMF